jgi:hypothetical protein
MGLPVEPQVASQLAWMMLGLVVGGAIVWLVARYYYAHAARELLAEAERLRFLTELILSDPATRQAADLALDAAVRQGPLQAAVSGHNKYRTAHSRGRPRELLLTLRAGCRLAAAAITSNLSRASAQFHAGVSSVWRRRVHAPGWLVEDERPDGQAPSEESVIAAFRERLISMRRIDRPLLLATGLALGLILMDVLLIAFGHLTGEHPLQIGVEDPAAPTTLDASPSTIIASTLSLATAWSFVLASTMHTHNRRLQLALLAAFSLFAAGATGIAVPLLVGLLAAMWAVNLQVWYRREISTRQWLPARLRAWGAWERPPRLTLAATVLFVFLVHFAALASGGWRGLGFATLTAASNLAVFCLAPVLVLTGTDFAEMAELMGSGAMHAARRLRGAPLAMLVLLVGCANVAAGIGSIGRALPVIIALLALLVALAWLVLARYDAASDSPAPPTGLLIALAVGLYFLALFLAQFEFHNDLVGIVSGWATPFAFFGFPVFGWIAWQVYLHGNRLEEWRGFVYLISVGAFAIFFGMSIWAFQWAGYEPDISDLVLGANSAIGAATLVALVAFWVWGIRGGRYRNLLATLLALNVGTGLLTGLATLLLAASVVGEELSAVQAIVICIALAWDFWTSGHFTNHDGRILARRGRLLMFLGYIVAVAAAVLLLSPQRVQGVSLDGVPFSSEIWPRYGIILFGFALIVAVAAQRIRRGLVGIPDRLGHVRWMFRFRLVRVLSRTALAAALVAAWLVFLGVPITAAGLASDPAAPSDWPGHHATTGDISLQTPVGWEDVVGPKGNVLALEMNRFPIHRGQNGTWWSDTSAPPLMSFALRVFLFRDKLHERASLDEYANTQFTELRDDSSVSELERQAVQLRSIDAVLFSATFENRQTDGEAADPDMPRQLGYTQYAFVQSGYGYSLVFWTALDRADQDRPLFAQMAHTIRFAPGARETRT